MCLLLQPTHSNSWWSHQLIIVNTSETGSEEESDSESYRQLEDNIDTTMLEVFGDYDIDTGSDNSDNDSLDTGNMDV